MVLGFGKKKKPVEQPVVLRTSPSLPVLPQQRIPWPKDLVDLDAVYAEEQPAPLRSEGSRTTSRPSKTSFQGVRGPVPFHRPFREGTTIASLFTPSPSKVAGLFGSGVPPPPSSYNAPGNARSRTGSNSRARRAKAAPTFNVMVVGPRRTGKTSLINLLLNTSNISPGNTQEQLNAFNAFRKKPPRPTRTLESATIEILQAAPNRSPSSDDRIALKCIDTPGLDYSEGKEFALEVSVSEIVKYIEQQFAETMQEESKKIRMNKDDQHVHLCIYLIDPDSVMTPAARRAKSRYDTAAAEDQQYSEYDSGTDDEREEENDAATDAGVTNGDVESEDDYGEPDSPVTPIAATPPPFEPTDDTAVTEDGAAATNGSTTAAFDDKTPRNSVDTASQSQQSSSMSPKSKLATPPASPLRSKGKGNKEKVKSEPPLTKGKNRLSMLPAEVRIISRLAKRVNVLPIIARGDTLTDTRLECLKRAVRRDLSEKGVSYDVWTIWDSEPGVIPGRVPPPPGSREAASAGTQNDNGTTEDNDDDERESRPVIKLRGTLRGLTRSRSRRSLKSVVDAELDEPDAEASPGYPLTPASPTVGNDSLSVLSKRESVASGRGTDTAGQNSYGAIFSRPDLRMRMPFVVITPERERESKKHANGNRNGNANGHDFGVYGRFVRHFRWGTIDVLDPNHCDFAALRAAVLGSYMRSLKAATKDGLYERFRTEKLLARRATANISDSERKRIMEDLGLSP
ncbi:hypothetical protein M422DRAFT_240616 [Sphaerobolus stellatus SS14]|nr:hypothetical protein M422DRAFT_240616 [Sphaerobolus stellatus SS14]